MTNQNFGPSRPVGTPTLAAVFFFFFVSGACGLLYQVVWTRKLVLLFGATSYAVSTVLSIFFLGLAIGSFWGGRFSDRVRRPLRLYGILEIVIGIWAVLFLVLIGYGESAVVEVLRWAGTTRALEIAMRAALAGVLLIVPVTLMGATLPLLARFVTARGRIRGLRIGALYSLNTLGAVCGCAIAGFVLLAEFGYLRTTLVGAALNVVVGVLALVLARHERGVDSTADVSKTEDAESGRVPATPSGVALVVLAGFALSGFCALALEVLWTRLLAIVFLGTTYAFTTMLTTVLCGIALGSAFASLIIDRVHRRIPFFGFTLMMTGAASVAMLSVFPGLPDMLTEAKLDGGYEWGATLRAKFFLSFAVLFLPTFLFGMSFPVALKAYAERRSSLGRDVGALYGANTLGGVAGALVGGFVLVPYVGAHQGVLILSAALGVGGFAVVLSAPVMTPTRRGATAALGAGICASAFWFAPADVSYALNQSFLPEEHELIHYSEGIEGTVAVSAPIEGLPGKDRVLWINAVQATASIDKGVKMNRFQGMLPFLFDREIETALFMCFGSGITAGTLALSPVEQIDAVELSEEVFEAAPLFEADNFQVLENPRVNPMVGDGRNFLFTTPNTYDLITFEPMPLALAGVSTFYTKEYYELCRARLAPGGLVSQWIPLHNGLSLEVIQSLFRTFAEAFPEVSVWFINADMFFIGSEEPLSIDYAKAEQRLAENDELREGLAEVYLGDLPELLAAHFMDRDALLAFADGAEVMTDDRPWAEFMAPKQLYEGNVAELLQALQPHRKSALDLVAQEDSARWPAVAESITLRHRAHMQDLEGLKVYYGGIAFSEPEIEFRKSLEIDPKDANAKYYLTQILVSKGQVMIRWEELDKAIAMLTEARGYSPDRLDVHLALGDAYAVAGQPELATASYARYVALGGASARAQ